MLHGDIYSPDSGTSAAIFAMDNALESNSNLMHC